MVRKPEGPLRRGWTTGACATGATRAALMGLWGGRVPDRVRIVLPRGETPEFEVTKPECGPDWARACIVKDAGDDPDVTHGALICAQVRPGAAGQGVRFFAGEGVGTVTRPGLPIAVGEPAINPVPRAMMAAQVQELSARYGRPGDIDLTISIPGGEALAQRTWNPRLGIVGGLSVLGTTGIVRPFSCAAWIASIHRGIDVARASGMSHVAGCTGAASERAVRKLHALPEAAMLDMGDFVGGLVKYLRRHPVPRLTIGGGIAKMVKLAQGATDLHSGRSQVDFARLAEWARAAGLADVGQARTVLEALEISGPALGQVVADHAAPALRKMLGDAPIRGDIVVVDRQGEIIGRAEP